jgi:hypothetical protein
MSLVPRFRQTAATAAHAIARDALRTLLLAGLLTAALGASGPGFGLAGQDPPPAEEDWEIFVDLGLDAAGGNSNLVILRSALGLNFVGSERVEFDLSGSFRYGEDDAGVIERQSRAAIKMDLDPQAAWSPFAFGSGFRDAIRRRLDFRGELGIGVKHTFIRRERTEASLSGAVVGTLEKFTEVPDLETPDDRAEARLSWRSRLEQEIRDGTALDQILFYQPVWDSWGDYIFLARTSLRSRLVGSLSLVLSHEFIHDETPAETVAKDDWTFNLGLRYEF